MNAKSARKYLLLATVFLAQFFFLGCNEDIVDTFPGDTPSVFFDDPNGVVGRWQWARSEGGMGGPSTPESSGITLTYWLKPDSTFMYYTKDTLRGTGRFRTYRGWFPFGSSGLMDVLEFYDAAPSYINRSFEFQFPCPDTMLLDRHLVDVGRSYFRRIRPAPSMAGMKKLLIGSWEWTESENVFDGRITPGKSGYTEEWIFLPRGFFLRFRNDTLFQEGVYKIIREPLPPDMNDTLMMLMIAPKGDYTVYGKAVFCGRASLVIDESPFCWNCGFRRFLRRY